MEKLQAILSGETYAEEFMGERCAFIISLSFSQTNAPQAVELEEFSAAIKRLDSAFKITDIILSDTLNKHNALIYYPQDDPEKKALELGNTWLEGPYYKAVELKNVKLLVMRWQELLSEENYPNVRQMSGHTYDSNEYFRATVDFVCAKFVTFICDRRKKSLEKESFSDEPKRALTAPNFDPKKAYGCCLAYVLEECAATLMLRLKGYTNLFHLGKVNAAVNWVAKNPILCASHSELNDAINSKVLAVNTVSKYKPYQGSTKSIEVPEVQLELG
jgi:hypothetical protein